MDKAISLSKRSKFFLLMLGLAFLCWGRLLFLKGIWWDDWAWVWHYFDSNSLSDFLIPFKSLRHPLDGFLFFLNFKLLDIIPGQATTIWSIWKFVIFVLNPLLVYFIVKALTDDRSILPETIALAYLVSPIVNNLCTVELGRRLYMFFFLLSILFSIRSVSKSGIKIPYYLSALFFSAISIFGLESFIFFELARPALILYLLNKKRGGNYLKNARQTALYWAPFFIMGALILFYNMGFMQPRSGIYAHAYDLQGMSIGKYVIRVIKRYIISVLYLLTNSLYLFINQNISIRNVYFFVDHCIFVKKYIFIAGSAFLSALFTIFALIRIDKPEIGPRKAFSVSGEARAWAMIGAILTILGLFPYMVVREALAFGLVSRHALLSSLGCSIFLPSVLLWLYYSGRIRKAFYCALFGGIIFFGVFNCNAAVKAYDDDWQQQRSFWSRFAKRVPEIKDNIYLIVIMPRNERLFFGGWRGSYEFSAPLNMIYATSRDKDEVNRHFAEDLDSALNPDWEGSYASNKNKVACHFESYKGTQKLYPQNLIVASYSNGRLYMNNEIIKAGMKSDIRDVVAHSSPEQIVYKTRGLSHPLRSIVELDR